MGKWVKNGSNREEIISSAGLEHISENFQGQNKMLFQSEWRLNKCDIYTRGIR